MILRFSGLLQREGERGGGGREGEGGGREGERGRERGGGEEESLSKDTQQKH